MTAVDSSGEYETFFAGYVAGRGDQYFTDLDVAEAYDKWVAGGRK